jgi:hypothetical protein
MPHVKKNWFSPSKRGVGARGGSAELAEVRAPVLQDEKKSPAFLSLTLSLSLYFRETP